MSSDKGTKAGGKGSRSSSAPNRLSVARGAGMVIIRVTGSGNMMTAPALQEFADEQRLAGFRRFLFDLCECRGMDSTFMGCIVGIYTSLRKDSGRFPVVEGSDPDAAVRATAEQALAAHEDDLEALTPEEALGLLRNSLNKTAEGAPVDPELLTGGIVAAVNVNEECRELLNILGVDRFVRIVGTVDLSKLEMEALPIKEMASDERREIILRAHENLVEIDKRNEAQFGAFLRTLSAELSKSKEGRDRE
ncbi:MAG: STAS domain-containing protein [Planctomycetota bacterium]|nr:STAS domain-containing protein [Planctomycetota bacterium]